MALSSFCTRSWNTLKFACFTTHLSLHLTQYASQSVKALVVFPRIQLLFMLATLAYLQYIIIPLYSVPSKGSGNEYHYTFMLYVAVSFVCLEALL